MGRTDLEQRVRTVAEQILAEQKYVAPVDVLLGLGWLAPAHVDQWRQGRVDCLEQLVQANLSKISTAMAEFRRWARARELTPSSTDYRARTRDRRPLRFGVSAQPSIEEAYRMHWVSPQLSERAQDNLAQRHSRPPELVVISPLKDWTCTSCAGTGDLLMMKEPGPLCLECADLGHLEFLPSGDAAVTRRAKKASGLSAVVVRWSRSRNRYERQGILVEPSAIEAAQAESGADADARARRRVEGAARRAAADAAVTAEWATAIRAQFPGCPSQRVEEIARHSCAVGRGRIGRTAIGRALDARAVELAVAASIRHRDTPYDALLMSGVGRGEARERVRADVERVGEAWRGGGSVE